MSFCATGRAAHTPTWLWWLTQMPANHMGCVTEWLSFNFQPLLILITRKHTSCFSCVKNVLSVLLTQNSLWVSLSPYKCVKNKIQYKKIQYIGYSHFLQLPACVSVSLSFSKVQTKPTPENNVTFTLVFTIHCCHTHQQVRDARTNPSKSIQCANVHKGNRTIKTLVMGKGILIIFLQ